MRTSRTKNQRGFVTFLLVALIIGLGLVLSGSLLRKDYFPQNENPVPQTVITTSPQSQKNLQLQPLEFTKICDFDSVKTGACTCPDKQIYGPGTDGNFYYTNMPEQECRFISPDKVNSECTLLKLCEQNVGPCSWNAPSVGPASECLVPPNISGSFVDLPPPNFGKPSVNCAAARARLLSTNGAWCIGKPVIYLYPKTPTVVDVKLNIPGEIYISIPLYPDDGWKNILAEPDGSLTYNAKTYHELYYESKVKINEVPTDGIIIPVSRLKEKLWEITQKLGLKSSEQSEFLEYWLPKLRDLNKQYIIFSLLSVQEKERIDGVKISPKPDVFINFIAYFRGVDYPVAIEPLTFPTPAERYGFTAVEWGGTIGK